MPRYRCASALGNRASGTALGLPMLAYRAGAEIDEYLRHARDTGFAAVREVAALLRDPATEVGPGEFRVWLYDPIAPLTLAHAVRAAERLDEAPVRNAELLEGIQRVQTLLESLPEATGTKEMEAVRDFCFALSQAAMTVPVHDGPRVVRR